MVKDGKQKEEKKQHLIDVQPIRDLKDLESMKWSLKRWCSERDYIIFLLGINSGLRVSDLVDLQVQQLKGKKQIKIKERKTKKNRMIYLHSIYEEINQYIDSLPAGSVWMFPSRKGTNHITANQVYRQLVKAGEMIDLKAIGTHTMRKTFGYWHYKQYKDVAQLQEILNHSHPSVTMKYIGITEEEIENNMKHFKL